jgi:hypothetical protein
MTPRERIATAGAMAIMVEADQAGHPGRNLDTLTALVDSELRRLEVETVLADLRRANQRILRMLAGREGAS